jgi:hypothetical protein
MDAYKIGERDVRYIGRIIIALFFVAVLIGYFIGKAFAGDFGLCCDSYSSYSASSSSLESSHSLGNSGPVTIQPPVGVPSHAYTSPNGTITIQPPAGPPTFVYPGAMPSSPVTVQPPVGLPSYIYGR